MELHSSFSFLVNVAETFGYTPEAILQCDFNLLLSMIKERNYITKKRNSSYGETRQDDDGDYYSMPDFDTGEIKRIKKVKVI